MFSDLWDWGLALSFILLYYLTTKYKSKSIPLFKKQDALSIAVKLLIHMLYQGIAILNDALWVESGLLLYFKRKVLLRLEVH